MLKLKKIYNYIKNLNEQQSKFADMIFDPKYKLNFYGGKFDSFNNTEFQQLRKQCGGAISTYKILPKNSALYAFIKNNLMLGSKLTRQYKIGNYQFNRYLSKDEKYVIHQFTNTTDHNDIGYLMLKTPKAYSRFN